MPAAKEQAANPAAIRRRPVRVRSAALPERFEWRSVMTARPSTTAGSVYEYGAVPFDDGARLGEYAEICEKKGKGRE